MRRRDFVTFLGGATAWVATARAQEPRRVIGVLGSASSSAFPGGDAAFLQGLKEAGFIEGGNISIEWRWAEGQYDRLPSLAGELLGRHVAVIVGFDGPASFAAKAATTTIPIVFLTGADPVKTGLVDSFSRPSGNLTGMSILFGSLGQKHVELLRELFPTASTIGVLVNPGNPNVHAYRAEIEVAAKAFGQGVEVLKASGKDDLEAAFATMVQQRADVLVVTPDAFFYALRKRLVALAANRAMPAIYAVRWFPEVGGLMSYGPSPLAQFHQAGAYTGKLLKGAKPADLPVQQSTTFELVINLKTANVLGLTLPSSLLARADEVIE
jgi:putative tryptophan/tyrosine transport system substrate-binding protein